MKKICVMLLLFFVMMGFASALEIQNASSAYDDVYGFVRPGDEIKWDRFWYYINSNGHDTEECKNVKILLSDGLSFSKTEKQTVKDLGEKCGSNMSGPVLNVPPPNNLVDKIYVNADAEGGYENIVIQFGEEIIDYDIYFLVLTDKTSNDVISNKSRMINIQNVPDYLDYYIYEPDEVYYVFFDGELISDKFLDFVYPNGCDEQSPCTPVNLCFDCDTNLVTELRIYLGFLDELELGDHTLTFISENGGVVNAHLIISDSTIIKTYQENKPAPGSTPEPNNCYNKSIKFTFYSSKPSINELSVLKINNKPVLSTNYSVNTKNNEIEITLNEKFVASLEFDTLYTLDAEFIYGTAHTTFRIDSYCDEGNKINILSGYYQILNLSSNKKILEYDLYTPKNYRIDTILIDGYEVEATPSTLSIPSPSKPGYSFDCQDGLCTRYSIDLSDVTDVPNGTYQVTFINNDGNTKNAYIKVVNSDSVTTKNYTPVLVGATAYCNSNTIKFTIDDPGSYFSDILLNNQYVLKSNYSISRTGQTVVTLNKEFVSKLESGNYTIKFIFADGDTSIDFKIKSTEECVEPITYDIIVGSNQVLNTINNKDAKLSFTIAADLSKFVNLYVNNEIVDKSNYSLKSGSTIITFNETYTQKLANGKYDLKVEFTDGIATTSFVVNNAEIDNPHTGAFISSMILIPCLIVGVILYRNKKRLFI